MGKIFVIAKLTVYLSVSVGKKISMSGMIILKWTDRSGKSQVLRLQQEMSPKWMDIGKLLSISEAELENWRKMHHDPSDCMSSVIGKWKQRNSEKVRDLERN